MSDSVTPQTVARWAPLSWNSPGQNTGVGSHSLLKGIFPTQGSNFGLLHCRQILHHLSQQISVWRVAVHGQRPHRIPRNAPPSPPAWLALVSSRWESGVHPWTSWALCPLQLLLSSSGLRTCAKIPLFPEAASSWSSIQG